MIRLHNKANSNEGILNKLGKITVKDTVIEQ